MFVNVTLFGGFLGMGESFTAGLVTGIGGAWFIFFVAGLIALRGMSLATAVFRPEVLVIRTDAKDAVALFSNGGLVVFGLAWFVFSLKV